MMDSEFAFLALVVVASGLYSAVLLWLTLTYHDNQNIRRN